VVLTEIFPSLLARSLASREREKTRAQFCRSMPRGSAYSGCCWGKSLAYLLVGVSVAGGVMGLGGLIFQSASRANPTPLWWAPRMYRGGGAVPVVIGGAQRLTEFGCAVGVTCWVYTYAQALLLWASFIRSALSRVSLVSA